MKGEKFNLPDTQNQHDDRGISIPKVGLNHLMIPLEFGRGTIADCSLYVSLAEGVRGTNMSRLAEVLLWPDYPHPALQARLIATRNKTGCGYCHIKMEFPFVREVTQAGKCAFKAYSVILEGTAHFLQEDAEPEAFYDLTVTVPFISTCPCSQAMILSQDSPGAPHMQRATAEVTLRSLVTEFSHPDAVRLIEQVEQVVSPTPFPILKRPEELEIAYECWESARFVEDVARDLHQMLDKWARDFLVVVEAEESIHQHNAIAITYKGVPGGLR